MALGLLVILLFPPHISHEELKPQAYLARILLTEPSLPVIPPFYILHPRQLF